MVQILEHRILKQVNVEVQDVKFVRAAVHLMQHRQVTGGVIPVAKQAQALGRAGCELGRRLGVPAGEQRDFVTLADQFFCNPADDALGAAVELRRDGLRQRSDLAMRTKCLLVGRI